MSLVGCGKFLGLMLFSFMLRMTSFWLRFDCVIWHWFRHCCRTRSLARVALGVEQIGKAVAEWWCRLKSAVEEAPCW